jgi:D-xylose 1-dehydrogenase (NADP+, D-xylono-1,5-lactone-forming)
MMDKTTRWGILSTAKIARNAMIPALQETALAEVVAVSSRNMESARSCAEEFGIPKAYDSYEALLADPDIDAVYNPLPNHLHKPWTIQAAEAGKHILCEKPLALNTEECQAMIAAAKANGVQLMEAFMYRYQPRIKTVRQMVADGVLGELKAFEMGFTYNMPDKDNIRYNPEMGGGGLMDVGCYCINLSRLLAGREPISVNARAYWSTTGVDEQLSALLDFGDGLIAHFDCGMNQATRQHCIISGSDGYLELPMTFNPLAFNMGNIETHINVKRADEPTQVHSFAPINMYRLIAEDFIGSFQGRPPAFAIEDSLGNMHVIQALMASARQNGQTIAL